MAIQDFTAGQVLTAAQMDSLQANDYNWTVSTKTASYVLVAADKGTRVVMNSASATTITVNTSIFAAGDVLWIQNINSGTCTITAGTCTVNTAGSLALSQWQGGSLYFTSASTAIFFLAGGSSYGTATGGIGSPTSVTIGGVNYQYLQFNSTGTLTITRAGFFDFLAIGGGTGGGANGLGAGRSGVGGGAGRVVFGSLYLSSNQTITIGAGGGFYVGPPTANFQQGSDTTIAATSPFTVTASGGSIGYDGNGKPGLFIGGGNGAWQAEIPLAIPGLTANGFKGGLGNSTTGGGGGGGQSGAGGNASGTTGGVGGTGVDISTFIGGSASYRATGGGGGGSVTGGAGGNSSASSNAGTNNTTPNSAAANSGSGGGGGHGTPYTTGNGGSGVCFIRYKV